VATRDVTPQTFSADYVGEPGQRAFFLQARHEGGLVSLALEKQQVAVLAEKLRELLVMVDNEDTIRAATPARDPGLSLQQPIEPEWRVGTMGLAYERDDDIVILLAQPVEAEDDEEPQEEEEESGFRFLLRRDQVRTFVLHAIAVVAEGRPTCQLCGLPIDPEGHICPATNGHRSLT
jgi:uncharacterized repeat protein (TIGR03847 family)